MTVSLQNGRYDAKLAHAVTFLTSGSDHPAVEFLWELERERVSAKSILAMCKADGSPNTTGITLTRSWATDWDGKDPEWFVRNLSFCRLYRVSLVIENGKVKFVNPRNHWGTRPEVKGPSSDNETSKPFSFDPERLAQLPSRIEPSMLGVWAAYRFLAEGMRAAKREEQWLKLVSQAAPGKLQIDFTAEDWQKVIELIK